MVADYSVFVSQPMRGVQKEEIERVHDECMERAREHFAETGETCREVPCDFGPSAYEQMRPLELLGKSLELMSFADVVVFAPNWRDAKGCRIQHEMAREYGMPLIELL